MDGWVQDLWLVAIVEDVPDDDVRRWWNGNETAILDDLVEAAPGIRLGMILTISEDPEPGSPTRRVFELMFLRGTCPEEFDRDVSASYVLPVLDTELRAALLAAFSPRPEDHVLMEVAPLADLAAFLDRHEGARLATHPRAEAVRVTSIGASGWRETTPGAQPRYDRAIQSADRAKAPEGTTCNCA